MSQTKLSTAFVEEPREQFKQKFAVEKENTKDKEDGGSSLDQEKRLISINLRSSLDAGLGFIGAISFAILFFVLFMASLDWLSRYDLSLSNPGFDIRFIIPIAMILSSLVAVYIAIGDMVRVLKAKRST